MGEIARVRDSCWQPTHVRGCRRLRHAPSRCTGVAGVCLVRASAEEASRYQSTKPEFKVGVTFLLPTVLHLVLCSARGAAWLPHVVVEVCPGRCNTRRAAAPLNAPTELTAGRTDAFEVQHRVFRSNWALSGCQGREGEENEDCAGHDEKLGYDSRVRESSLK